MQTIKLSRKGQVLIPKAIRAKHRGCAGLEFIVLNTKGGILLKPKPAFQQTLVSQAFGFFRAKVAPKTDHQIAAALLEDIRSKGLVRG